MGLHLRAPCMVPRVLSSSPSGGNTGSNVTLNLTGYHLTGSTKISLEGTNDGTAFSVTNDGAVTCSMHVPNWISASYQIFNYNPRCSPGAYAICETLFAITA